LIDFPVLRDALSYRVPVFILDQHGRDLPLSTKNPRLSGSEFDRRFLVAGTETLGFPCPTALPLLPSPSKVFHARIFISMACISDPFPLQRIDSNPQRMNRRPLSCSLDLPCARLCSSFSESGSFFLSHCTPYPHNWLISMIETEFSANLSSHHPNLHDTPPPPPVARNPSNLAPFRRGFEGYLPIRETY